ncbi:MAG: SBBP repeat-containing protein [Acidobacteria bacterium]|nr:SBBP repeat-containing protein [Acidobacteriota bacterium]
MVNRSGVGPAFARVRGRFLLVLLVVGAGFLLKRDAAQPEPSNSRPSTSTEIQAALRRLPMSFEPNRGQAASGVEFLAHGNGYGLYLLPSRAVLALAKHTRSGLDKQEIEMEFGAASRRAAVTGADRLAGHSNYFIGNDSSRWLRNVPQFARVRYQDVYPGIDLAFYGNENRLEYDFEVSPGSDAREIELDFKGADEVSLAANGDLVLGVDGGELRFEAPHVYQTTSSGVQTVAGSFVLRGKTSAGFEIGPYDRSRALVIDPVLSFSSYLGGGGDESCTAITGSTAGFVPHCPSIALDSGNRIYVAGATTSPTIDGVTPTTIVPSTTESVFVSQIGLKTTGGATTGELNFVTYIGGTNGVQYPVGVGVDGGFAVYVAGTTSASDYPTISGTAFQAGPPPPGNHAFISKITSNGTVNTYSTYLFGNGVDTASNMTIDTLGRVYVIGTTTSSDFPTTVGALQPAANATNQFFFSKIDPALNTTNSLQYSTYIGGSAPSDGIVKGGAVAVDANFNVYLAGGTNFTDMGAPNPWILNAFKASPPGGPSDVWAAKLNAPPNKTQQYTLAYGTYFGGTGDDVAYGIATDGTSTYITGSTTSSDIPTTGSTTLAFQSANAGGGDAFVAKFGLPAVVGTTQGQVPLDYFSYLGGSANDVGLGIVADSLGNARVVGFTESPDLCANSSIKTCGPPQASLASAPDAFIARLNTVLTSTVNNTSTASYFGGSGRDIGTEIALDTFLNTYVTGETGSANFPVCPGPECAAAASALPGGNAISGASDAFVAQLGPNTSQLAMPQLTGPDALPACNAANPTVSPSPASVGSPVTFTYHIYNPPPGDPVSGVQFTDTLGVGSGSTSATTSQGTCGGATTTGPLTCSLGTVNTSTTTTLTTANTCGSTTSTNFAATVTVMVTAPTTVLAGTGSIGNSANISFPGGSTATISGSVPLNDYAVAAALAPPSVSSTIPSGGQVNFAITVTPTGAGFSQSVSLACGSGLPSGATCTFTNNPIPNMSGGPQSRALAIATTARVTTTAGFLRRGFAYGIWLPVLGIGIMGAGVSRRRRLLLGIFFALALIGTALAWVGCSYSRSNTTTTSGTPAGTYTVVVNANSGTAVRSTSVQFTVE